MPSSAFCSALTVVHREAAGGGVRGLLRPSRDIALAVAGARVEDRNDGTVAHDEEQLSVEVDLDTGAADPGTRTHSCVESRDGLRADDAVSAEASGLLQREHRLALVLGRTSVRGGGAGVGVVVAVAVREVMAVGVAVEAEVAAAVRVAVTVAVGAGAEIGAGVGVAVADIVGVAVSAGAGDGTEGSGVELTSMTTPHTPQGCTAVQAGGWGPVCSPPTISRAR